MSTLVAQTISNGTVSTSSANVIQGSAKAWVNFNGTGTVAIRGSYNVSSITDNGTGDYTVNFTNALADANYAFLATTEGSAVATENNNTALKTTTQIGMNTLASSTGSTVDRSQISVSVFR